MSPKPIREFALYRLDPRSAQRAAGCSEPFDPVRYIACKYGSTRAADWFAARLAAGFPRRHSGVARLDRVLIASSP